MPKLIFCLLSLPLLWSNVLWAYIPPAKMIFQRVAENAGSGIYTIEQEVQINTGIEPVYLRETWTIENERTLRLTVSGTKDLKDLVKLQYVYVGGQKWQLKDGKREALKIPEEFLERYFHVRNSENLVAYLQQQKILPSLISSKKTAVKKGEEFKYEPETFVRLGRAEGVVNYAFGTPTPPDQKEPLPGIWIEQDQFVIRKLRLPTQTEVTAENYGAFVRGLNFPKLRTIQWNQNTVFLRVLSVVGKSFDKQAFQPTSIETPVTIKALANPSAQTVIEEFYTRFR